eukprot:m.55422 g.55422  ORF g.55422 m.55422 type:complete len:202 (-) comp12530_c0_seq1:159-764(-)
MGSATRQRRGAAHSGHLPNLTISFDTHTCTHLSLCSYVGCISCATPQWPLLMHLAKAITRVCHNINRVVYCFGNVVRGPVKRITPTLLTPDVLGQLRKADAVVNDLLLRHSLTTTLSQVPVISVPIDLDADPASTETTTKRCIAIRTFITSDFMTGIPATPGQELGVDVLSEMVAGISKVSGVSRVLFDLTAKPPGTTEWE